MKKHFFLLGILCATVLLFTACGGDDDKIGQPASPGGQGRGVNNENANLTDENIAFGNLECPAIMSGDNYIRLIRRTNQYGITYMIEWDKTKKAQRWTCFQMNGTNNVKNWARSNWKNTSWGGDPFQVDPDLPTDCRTELSQYSGSGYDRGHICASEDRVMSKDANEQTFYLSNMHPQKNAFNAAPGVWGQMEIWLRDLNNSSFRDVLYIVKGGTIKDDQVKSPVKGLVVPQYFFMAVVCEKRGEYKGLGFWANHDNPYPIGNIDKARNNPTENVKLCVVSIDKLEQLTGMDFFCNLPDDIEKSVEASVNLKNWGF